MALREPKFDDFDTALKNNHFEPMEPGEADESGVSPQHTAIDTPQPTVKADVAERQAVEVRPMRYVLGIGIALAIVALFVAWMLLR